MRARLMGVDADYDDSVERQNAYPDLLLQEAQEYVILEESGALLHKVSDFCKMMAARKTSLPEATKKTQASVVALLLKLIMRRT